MALPAAGSATASTTTAGLHRYFDRRCLVQSFTNEPVKAGSSSDGQMLLLLSLSLCLLPRSKLMIQQERTNPLDPHLDDPKYITMVPEQVYLGVDLVRG